MEKEAVIHYLQILKVKYPRQFSEIDVDSVELYMDVTTEPELLKEIIGANRAKFMLIMHTILSGEYNDDFYKKEDDCVYAMRFSKPNSRIYCKEVYGIGSKKKIIMSRGILNKTSQKNNKTNIPLIKALKTYEFKYFKKYESTEDFKIKEKRNKQNKSK